MVKTALLILFLIFGGNSYPVIQQYGQDAGWVSRRAGAVTQFNRGEGLGFLAHNWLAGGAFYPLRPGDIIQTVDDAGGIRDYRVTGVYRYQQTGPDQFLSLDNGRAYTGPDVLAAMFLPGELTLQTCISQDGVDDWGRLFVHAKPVETEKQNTGRRIYVIE